MCRKPVPLLALVAMALGGALALPAPAAVERHATLPVVSPDGRRIVYVSSRDSAHSEIRVVGVDGRDDAPIAVLESGSATPSWSADGRRIVFALADRDTAQLFTMRTDGSDQRRLVSLVGKGVRLSPDGRRIAYTSGTWTRNRIVVASLDLRRASAITDSSAGYFNLAWSPTGDRIAATRIDGSRALEVWVIGAGGAGARAIARFAPADGRPQWPAWAPDGRRVAIQAGTYDRAHPELDSAHLWVIDLATGRPTRLGSHDRPRLDETPAWFPDGRRLAYQSNASGRFEVWVMNADGTALRQVTH